ncbi:MAG: gliding motility-associated C-terminal domain-containing protein [Phaeodactylibacter sp.]|nr:gliding motility-associated C-terminal domain-containing protein [Phaeodactylibacter sp.]
MKRFLFLCLLFQSVFSTAQVEVRLIVESAVTASDCDDLFSGPDLLWEVNVENEGWVTYPQNSTGTCFTALPNQQYTANFTCAVDVPAQLQVCFRAFENDPILPIGCPVTPSCLEEICGNFDIPAPGQSMAHTLALPAGGSSTGEVSFTIEVEGTGGDNDAPCTALDLGLLNANDTLGDFNQGIYSTLCATLVPGEPNPINEGGFNNETGVWFQFTTGNDIGSLLLIQALSDPESAGDSLDIQLAVYGTDNNACDGNLSLLLWNYFSPPDSYDVFMNFPCPQPNTTYYILVDGAYTVPGSEVGIFGLQVINIGVQDAPDERCDALILGAVPEGGSVSLPEPLANFCATSVGDPFSPSFVSQSSVWFQFAAPLSGHIIIDAVSAREIDSIGIQLALYRPLNGNCNGFFQHIASQYTLEDLDESMEVTCLYPGDTYYLMVDGDADANRGIFDLTISDAGDITPVTNQDTTICFGDSFIVGSSVYTESGSYSDTLQVFRGCDSIVNTNLTVLAPIVITVDQTQPAIGEGNANGIASVSATGSTGNFTFEWCDGSIGDSNNMLVGGSVCCVTAEDSFGCVADTCFTVEFITDIIPSFIPDTLACFGDEDGEIVFSAVNGQPPYTYTWQNGDDSINGNGTIAEAGEEVFLPDLPAGVYSITIMDMFFDTTFTVEVLEPELLTLQVSGTEDASCFGECDGSAVVVAGGGVGGYQFTWSNGSANASANGLCAGGYGVTVADANGCSQEVSLDIAEPAEFIATAVEEQPVSCFGGSDGIVTVETNGSPSAFQWSTGDNTATATGLPAGAYTIVVTNADGCQDEAEVILTEPAEPVSVQIVLEKPVSCQGDTDAILQAVASGPGQAFDYNWSNGAASATAGGLGAGLYSVVLTNEKGCEASAEFMLEEPTLIQAMLSATDVTCVSGENGGAIVIDTTFGGTPPYRYSLDGVVFGASPQFPALFADTYTVVIQDAAGCEQEFGQTVNGAPELVVELGDTRSLQLGDSLRLTAQPNSDNVVYSWSLPDSTGSKEAGQSIWVSPFISTGYYVEVFDTVTLCRADDFVMVNVRTNRRVYIPNAFSPNEDGSNDFFTVFADKAVVRVKSLRVFSRGGSLVYEAFDFKPNNNSRGWDGTFRGSELDPGVFAYVAEIEFIDGRTEVYKGDVMLMR